MLAEATEATVGSAAGWSALLGAVVPVVVAFVGHSGWTSTQKRLVAVGVSVVIGAGNLLVQGTLGWADFTWASALADIGLVIGAAQAAYTLVWKPTGAADKVETRMGYRPKHTAGP